MLEWRCNHWMWVLNSWHIAYILLRAATGSYRLLPWPSVVESTVHTQFYSKGVTEQETRKLSYKFTTYALSVYAFGCLLEG